MVLLRTRHSLLGHPETAPTKVKTPSYRLNYTPTKIYFSSLPKNIIFCFWLTIDTTPNINETCLICCNIQPTQCYLKKKRFNEKVKSIFFSTSKLWLYYIPEIFLSVPYNFVLIWLCGRDCNCIIAFIFTDV